MEEVKENKIGHSHVGGSRGRKLVDWGYISLLHQLDKSN
jgi:hypothetical protein